MSMRVPTAPAPGLGRPDHHHRRPTTFVYEEEDDEEPPPRSGPDSRRSRSRRDVSPQSARHYRSTPESRRSPRTSVSESEYETDMTMDSDEEQVIHPPHKGVNVAPVSRSVMHERLNRNLANQEVIYEDPDDDERDPRHAPSYGRRRSPSRQPSRQQSRQPSHRSHQSSNKRDQYRRPRDEYPEEVIIDDEPSHYGSKRPPRMYYEEEAFAPKPPPSLRRAHTVGGSHMASSHSLGSSARRSTFDNVFGFAPPHPGPGGPPRAVSCVVCMDDNKAAHETVKLKCGHHMCNRCLKRNFKLSLTDPQHMPPRCCTADHIPLEHVERLFDGDFKRKWNRKFAEYSTRNRLYCPTPHCGEWIRPENIRRDAGFHHGKCSRCKTKVCCACNGRWHYPRACPRDVETDRFLEQARQEGWQRCHRCNAVVELKEGCNHMTCRCGGEFCMSCGSKWKSCDCPWFNESLENEPDDYIDMAMDPRPNPFAGPRGFDAPRRFEAPSSPRDFRSDAGPPPLTGSVRPRPSSYEEEMMLHRLQKRRDTQKPAPKPRAYTEYDAPHGRDDGRGRERSHRASDPRAFDPARHAPPQARRPGDEYRRRPATVIVPAAPPQMHYPMVPPPPQSAFEAPSPGMDYGRPRGRRYASPETWHAPSEPMSPEQERWYARSRPQSPDGMPWPAPSQPQSPDLDHRGRWRSRSRAASPDRKGRELWRARSVARPIYASPERERSPSVETRRNPSRFPSRAASRAASRVPSRAPSPPETRRAPSPPASRRAPSPPASRRAPSAPPSHRAPSHRAPSAPPSRYAPSHAGTRRAPSPPGTHRSPSPDRRRSHTPARSRAQTPDRRRAHSPEQRRDTSMERRLAGRFNSETRQNSPAMVGALTPIGPVGHLAPMMMMAPPPPPPSYAPTQHTMGPPMPMAPVPPPAATPIMRRHMMEEEVYATPAPHSRGAVRSSERHIPPGNGLTRFYEQQEVAANAFNAHGGSPHAPHVRRRPPQATRVHGHELPRPSILAGLGGPGRGLSRVSEWRNYVEPGIPEGEQPPSIIAQ